MIELAVRRPVSVIVAAAGLCALGMFSLFKLPLSLLPAIDRPSLRITARAPLSSDEMLHEVTEPLERRLHAIPGVTFIESSTGAGESRIVAGAAWQTNSDLLRIETARRIEGAVNVPLDSLTVDSSTSDVLPVVEIAVTGATANARAQFARDVLVPELARLDGAGRVDVLGAAPLRLTVEPSAAELASRGLTAEDVAARLREVGRTYAAGRVREGASVRPVVVTQPIHTPDDLAALTIGSRAGSVPLRDVAVVRAQEVADETFFRVLTPAGAWQDGVLVRVNRAPGGNAVALARDVHRVVASPGRTPVAVRVVTDRSSEVRRALLELAAAALLGMLLGTLVLRYFLAAWRPTLALAVVIPIALLVSFSIFHLLDVPLDVISLAGLALATGLLVDNSIVVLESIHNARAEGAAEPVLSGTRAIAIAVISSSATLLIIFAPLLYLQGLARAIFGEQAVAVIASVSASVILSLTLTPVLAGTRGGTAEGRHPGRRHYLALLDAIATRPRAAVLVAVLITSIGIAGAVLLRRELFAASPVRQVVATFRVSPQLSVDAARATASALSIALLRGADRNELEGASVTYISAEGRGDVVLQFRTAAAAERVLERVRRHAVPLPGAIVDVRSRPSAFLESIGGNADQVEVIASAPTGAEADALAARITSAATSRGLAPVVDLARRGEPDFVLQWDEPRLASAGTTRRAAEEDVRAALGELDLGQTTAGAETRIRLLPVSPRRLDVVPVRVGSAVVPLAAVARIGSGSAARIVDHDDGRPARHLVFRRSAAGWPAVPLGAREHLRFAGHAAELQAANRELLLAAVLAAILLYLTVAAFYESLLLPFIVMLAIPFAAAGAIGGLLLFAQSLNIMSMIGLLFLSGIVVNHSVIFLDRVEMLRRAGVAEDEALRRAVTDRFRPVIMTTLTALLGMLPLALLGGDGVELRRPIAIVIIAGLITATCGTLLLLPLLHRAAERWRSHG